MLRPGMEERNEFSMGVLKWSSGFFDKVKLDMKHPSSVHASYQKTFGHYDLHEDFANNLWKGSQFILALFWSIFSELLIYFSREKLRPSSLPLFALGRRTFVCSDDNRVPSQFRLSVRVRFVLGTKRATLFDTTTIA